MLEEVVDATVQKFTVEGGDCRQTRQCLNPGHRCYKKNEHWAACKESCTAGIHMDDPPEHRTPWSCELISRASKKDEDCSQTRQCLDPGHRCHKKNEYWAACKENCTPGIHMDDPPEFRSHWSCELLSEATKDEDCSHSGMCVERGRRCFRKNEFWAGCKESCTPGVHMDDPPDHRTPWSCQLVSSTPQEDCSQTGLCMVPGHRCYKKDDHWAGCKESCAPGPQPDDHPDHRTPWSCELITL